MEKQKVIEKAMRCVDALKMGHGHYRPERFAEFADKFYEEWEDFYATVVMMAKESEREWIPCSERLPEEGKMYLVTYMTRTGQRRVGTTRCTYSGETPRYIGRKKNINGKIIAYMPLPEPYKGEPT